MGSMDRAFSIAGAIVTVALVTTIVSHRNSARVVNAVGRNATSFLRAAMGK